MNLQLASKKVFGIKQVKIVNPMSVVKTSSLDENTRDPFGRISSAQASARVSEEVLKNEGKPLVGFQHEIPNEKLILLKHHLNNVTDIQASLHASFRRILIRSLRARLSEISKALASGMVNSKLLFVNQILERFCNDLIEAKVIGCVKPDPSFKIRSRQKNPLNEQNLRLCKRLKLFRARIKLEVTESMQLIKKWENSATETSNYTLKTSEIEDKLPDVRIASQNALVKCMQIQKDFVSSVMSLDALNARCQVATCHSIALFK